MIIIDGTDCIFGRLATRIAKKALSGEEVHVINAEKMVIKGNPNAILRRFQARRAITHKANPEHAPKWPKVPHMLVKRMIRGMLPWQTARGRAAYRRITIHTGNPKHLTAVDFPTDKHDGISKGITIYELCKNIGYRK
ncbi:MAG: 50S ribosomal protein L13 [Candidatus Bilamarchaeaceae archaeon]